MPRISICGGEVLASGGWHEVCQGRIGRVDRVVLWGIERLDVEEG